MMMFSKRGFSNENVVKRILYQQRATQFKPVTLVSEYGELINLRPMTKLKPATSQEKDVRQVIMIDDNTDTKTLIKKMNHHPKSYFLYNPKGHHQNASALYTSLKKTLTKQFYGNSVKDEEHSFKGTIFSKLSLPYEVFHLQRRTKLNIKQTLSKLGFLVLRNGELDLKGDGKPDYKDLPMLIKEWEKCFDLGSSFSKPDYFLPFPAAEGIASAENLQTKGIQIHCLASRLIYPLYGVWTPTSQEYLSLLSNYVSQQKHVYSKMTNLVDLGCGTGVLPIVMSENADFQGQIFSVDSQPRALEATQMNSQIFGLHQRQTGVEFDLCDFYYKPSGVQKAQDSEMQFYKRVSKDLGMPLQVDLIVCNPPWIEAARLAREMSPLDNGVYDPDSQFLKSSFNFARLHLKKDGGQMLLLYSDMNYQLGLTTEHHVKELANEYGLRAELIDATQLPLNKKPTDPLRVIKRNSKAQLFKLVK